MEAVDFESADQQAKYLARYISSPSTIRAHCINSWGRSPSLSEIEQMRLDHVPKKPRKVAEPLESDGEVVRLGILPVREPVRSVQELRTVSRDIDFAGGRPIGRAIVETVADLCDTTAADIAGNSRKRMHYYPRSMVAKLLYQVRWKDGSRRFSLVQIGETFLGGRDHSTVIHAIRQFDAVIAPRSDVYRSIYEAVYAKVCEAGHG